MGIKPSEEPSVTEEEVKILIDQGAQSGVFEEMEQDMVESVFRLADRKVSAIMTARPDHGIPGSGRSPRGELGENDGERTFQLPGVRGNRR